ncbi:MAG: dockerin type I domain-containing protein [Planctomycetota bacterium]|jgi:hypothetical protein
MAIKGVTSGFVICVAICAVAVALNTAAHAGVITPVDVAVDGTYGEYPATNTFNGTFDGGNPQPNASDPTTSLLDQGVGDIWFGNNWVGGRIMWDLGQAETLTDVYYWPSKWRDGDFKYYVDGFDMYVSTTADGTLPEIAQEGGEVVPSTGDWTRVLHNAVVAESDLQQCVTYTLPEATTARWVMFTDFIGCDDHPSVGEVRFVVDDGGPPPSPADYDDDGDVDADDIDLWRANSVGGDGEYDLTGDGQVNGDDLAYLVENYAQWHRDNPGGGVGTEMGDFNLDGRVDDDDLAVLQAGFGTSSGLGWASGNTNADVFIDATDLAVFAAGYGFDAGGEPIPEPATIVVIAVGGVALLLRRR